MSRRVDLILPDAGPLISLAHANRLDLIEVFERRVVILDVVQLETVRKPDSPDFDRLRQWYDRAANKFSVVETPFGEIYRKALDQERSGADSQATRGLGDAALSWALQNIDRFSEADAIPLVLVEDRSLAVRLQSIGRAHILSTRAWLAALDDAGLVDYRAVVAAMADHGRLLSTLSMESPAPLTEGPTRWLPSTKQES